jgi:hypothetical protein
MEDPNFDPNGVKKERLRVFISYSHQDRELVEKVEQVLRENGLETLWDKNFEFGVGFTEQIKNCISHAHVFMPIITPASSYWVHQEIGYAMALNVPVLPVCRGQLPAGLASELHAVPLSDDPAMWKKQLSRETFVRLARPYQSAFYPLYECAEKLEHRTMMMVKYAQSVWQLGERSDVWVRQKGGLSSFHIPDVPFNHFFWRWRYGPRLNEFRCEIQRQERQVLEKHARRSGASLIIDPTLTFRAYGELAMTARYYVLLNFLESLPDEGVIVASLTKKHEHREHHITIVGDWFMAEAAYAHRDRGIRQTIFTRHAPSVRSHIEQFEEELHHLLEEEAIAPKDSRRAALAKIKTLLQGEINRLLGNRSLLSEEDQEQNAKRLQDMLSHVGQV